MGDTLLPFVTYAYNTATQTTTGFSPYFLLYGREASCPLDTILPYRPDATKYTPVSQLCTHAEECRQLVRNLTSEDQFHQKHRRADDNPQVTFSPGTSHYPWTF